MSTAARECLPAHTFLPKIADILALVRLWLLGFGQPIIPRTPKTRFAEHHPL